MDDQLIQQLRANAAQSGAMPVAGPQKTRGRGGFLTSLISEVGGAGGASGGAALGATLGSVVPGIGTAIGGVLGAGIGGFLGSTGGRLAENKIRDDEFRMSDALKEGAISGVLSTAGGAFKAVKAAKAAKAAGILSTGAVDDVAKAAGKSAQTISSKALGEAGTIKMPSEIAKFSSPSAFKQAVKSQGLYKGYTDKSLNTIYKSAVETTGKAGTVGAAAATAKGTAASAIQSGVVNAQDDIGKVSAKVAKQTAGSNPINRAGNALYRNTLGVDDLVAPGKTGPTTIFKADDMVKEAQRIGLKGSPSQMQRQVATYYDDLGKQVDKVLSTSTNAAQATGKNGLFSSAQAKIAKDLPLKVDGVSAQSEMQRVMNELGEFSSNGKITAAGVQKFKNKLATRLSGAFDKAAAGKDLNMKEMVDMGFWREADDVIAKLEPAAKSLTKQQSNLYGLSQSLARMTRSAGDPQSLSQAAIRAASPTIRSAENLLGRVLSGAGNIPGKIPGGAAIPGIAKGAAVRGVANQMFAPAQVLPDQTPQVSPDGGAYDYRGGMPPQIGPDGMPATDAPQVLGANTSTPTSTNYVGGIDMNNPAQLQQVLQQAAFKALQAGDTAAMKDIMAASEFFRSFEPEPGKDGLNSTAAQTITDLENGLVNIGQLSDQFQQSSANIPILGKVFAANPYNTDAQNLRANVARVKQVIGKALEGGVLRKEDEVKYEKILPTLNDTDAVASSKIQFIQEDLARKLALYKQNIGAGGGGVDLAALTGASTL